MSVFRPSFQSDVFEPATYFEKNGKQMAKFRQPKSGKLVTGEVVRPGKARIQSQFWYARLTRNGKKLRIALKGSDGRGVADKEAALQLRAKLIKHGEIESAGMLDPYAEHRGTRLFSLSRDYMDPDESKAKDHLWDYKTHLEASGCCAEWIGETTSIIQRICTACNFHYIEEFHTPSLNFYLVGLIRKGRSNRTRNKYLHSLRAFIHWMQRTDRMVDTDPFKTIRNLPDLVKRERRALSAEECTTLLTTTEQSDKVVQGIMPGERAIIYALALTSGLRAKEIALLRIKDLHLADDLPYIVLPASIAKAKRAEVVPVHPFVAEKLIPFVGRRTKDSLVFHLMTEAQTGGTGGKMRLTHRMIKADMKEAGIPYKTSDGFADFHALRTTFITNTCRLTDQFTAMKLARHTKATVTAKHYDKVLLSQRSSVVSQLPLLPAPKQIS